MEYYKRIRNIREDNDIKQYEFANSIAVLPKTYNLYESGRRTLPMDILDKILVELNLSLDYVFELKPYPENIEYHPLDLEQYARNIRKYRKLNHLTQDEMAKRLGCNQQTLSEYERGKLVMPPPTLQKFCKELAVSADVVTGRKK